MPGKGILNPYAHPRIKPLESEAGRYVLGLSATRRDDARRKHRSQRRHAFERTVRMPELIGLAAQGKPVVSGADLAIRTDRSEDHEMGACTQRADLGQFG